MEDLDMNAPSPTDTDSLRAFWQDRPTFVTGATGLVGAWTVRRLMDLGADVVCLVRDRIPQSEFNRRGLDRQVKTVTGDVTDQPLLERVLGEYEIQVAIHLAAQTIVGVANRNPVSTFESNIAGTWTLLEACRRTPTIKSIVLASSDKAYGAHEKQPYTEDMALQGRHPYDVSKSCSDLIGQAYAATYGLPVGITRCGNFFGGGDLNWNRLVPGTVRSVLRGQRPVIRSDGQFVRDYFYVEDGAAAYTLLAQAIAERPELRGRAFNFSLEQELTALEMVQRILGLMGSGMEPDIRNEAVHEIRIQRIDATLARRELAWSPQYTLDEGLSRTIDWYRRCVGGES
jgi:CDP-glucose 4,6-dehydratase